MDAKVMDVKVMYENVRVIRGVSINLSEDEAYKLQALLDQNYYSDDFARLLREVIGDAIARTKG
jgi:hypothetical protein